MKNIIISSLILVGGVLTISCSRDSFNELPSHLDTPATVFTTEEGFRKGVDGAYDAAKSIYGDDTGNMYLIPDALADNLIINPDGRFSNKSAYEWSYSPNAGSVTALYINSYWAISRANLVLDNIANMRSNSFMKNIEAEARGIRGMLHFEVARAYSKIPTQSADAPNAMGIAYVTTYEPAQKPSRDAKVSDSYAKIIEDLEYAYANINASNKDGRLNKNSVAAILNEVYLYMGDYANSIKYGEIVIGASQSVATTTTFGQIWKDASVDGVLLMLPNHNAAYDNLNVGVAYNQNSGGIKSEYNVDYELYKMYKDNDIRKSAYFLTQAFSGKMYNHVVKYRERQGSTVAGIVNIKYSRTAEVYLNTAEAYMRSATQNQARALQLLNFLRQNRYTGYTAGTETGEGLLTAIMTERRLEMAFENDRFWTLKRLGLPVVRSSYGPLADGTGAGPVSSIMTMPAGSDKWQLPIPQSEINNNPNMVQNPGY